MHALSFRLQSFVEEGEREMMNEQIAVLQEKVLVDVLVKHVSLIINLCSLFMNAFAVVGSIGLEAHA